jgi:Coenzyme PQQ synthesis protein D (PqqD)
MPVIPTNLKHVVNSDGALILDALRNAMTPLNSTGAYVWQRLERGMLLEDIVTELANETGADRARVAVDIDHFIDDLKSRHLLMES